jgi:hypothetical protein
MIYGTPKKDVWFPKGCRFHSLRTAALEDLILCVIYGLSLHYLVIHKNIAHLPPPPGTTRPEPGGDHPLPCNAEEVLYAPYVR